MKRELAGILFGILMLLCRPAFCDRLYTMHSVLNLEAELKALKSQVVAQAPSSPLVADLDKAIDGAKKLAAESATDAGGPGLSDQSPSMLTLFNQLGKVNRGLQTASPAHFRFLVELNQFLDSDAETEAPTPVSKSELKQFHSLFLKSKAALTLQLSKVKDPNHFPDKKFLKRKISIISNNFLALIQLAELHPIELDHPLLKHIFDLFKTMAKNEFFYSKIPSEEQIDFFSLMRFLDHKYEEIDAEPDYRAIVDLVEDMNLFNLHMSLTSPTCLSADNPANSEDYENAKQDRLQLLADLWAYKRYELKNSFDDELDSKRLKALKKNFFELHKNTSSHALLAELTAKQISRKTNKNEMERQTEYSDNFDRPDPKLAGADLSRKEILTNIKKLKGFKLLDSERLSQIVDSNSLEFRMFDGASPSFRKQIMGNQELTLGSISKQLSKEWRKERLHQPFRDLQMRYSELLEDDQVKQSVKRKIAPLPPRDESDL